MSGNATRSGDGALGLDSGLEALRASQEFHGPVEPLDGHHCNDHLALIYESRDEQFASIVPFIRQGLERGERCMYVIDELSEDEILAAMRGGGIDVDAAVESGALTFHTVGETYLRNGEFDPDEMIDFYASTIEEATEEYEALRIAAETTWLQDEATTVEQFMEYEAKVNELFRDEDCIAMCQYDRDGFPPEVIRDIVRTHPHLIYQGTVCHNFYHTPPAEFFGPDRAARENDRMLGTLLERTRAKTALEEREQFLRELYEVTAGPDRSFEEKLQALFELGCERFGLELGGVARIDTETDLFEVEAVSGDHEHLEPGARVSLSETYCRLVADGGRTIGVCDAETHGMENTTAVREFGVDTYLGTRVGLDSGLDRTLFFVSSEPRDEPFTDAERTCHRLMGQWVKYELERRQREEHLRDLYETTAASDRPFEAKVKSLLELGRERFDLQVGSLSQFRSWDGNFQMEAVVGADAPPEGEVPSVQPTSGCFCRRAMAENRPVSVPDVRQPGWDDDPVFEQHGLESYLGIKITVGAEPYGTLWFGDTSPREEPFSDAERTFLELMGQWVSYELEREHREAQLAALNEMSRALMDAETDADIAATAVDHAREALRLPLTAIVRYDDETGAIEPAARTPAAADEIPTATLCERGEGALWDAFVAGETRTLDDVASIPGAGEDVTEVVAVPLDRQGLFVVGSRADDGFSAAERDFVEATAATVAAAFTRADRERQLHQRERALEEQNETLQRLDRVNDIIRNIDRALVQASTRAEIEAVVCEQLAESGPYELAWVGEHDQVTDEVTPREWAGTEKGYLDEITVTADDNPTGRGPTGLAVKTREPQVTNDILGDPPFEPWRQAALNRGYHASIALPLVYQDTLYGVLNVYAGEPGVFDELERTVLTELADNIAHAINALESKKALVSDQVTELEFEVRDPSHPVVALTAEADCRVTLEGLVPRMDGQLRAFISTWGVSAEEVIEAHPPSIAPDVSLVSRGEQDGEPACLFEVELTDESISGVVLEHGGVVRKITAEDGTATVAVEL